MLIIVLFVNLLSTSGQVFNPGFAKYLYSKGSYHDILIMEKMDRTGLDLSQLDSMNYYTGLSYYNLQRLDEAVDRFKRIQKGTAIYNPSMFFAGWTEMYLGYPEKAAELLEGIRPSISDESELLQMFNVGCALMNRNSHEAGLLLEKAEKQERRYLPQWERMQSHNSRLNNFKPRSYAMAGVLSCIVPGSGKIYAGQKGAGVSSFLTLAAIGAILLENGIKTGWNSWNTITAAGVFGVFYLGNIYGSIVGIKIYREKFYDELNRAVLLDINIPLRNIYLQ